MFVILIAPFDLFGKGRYRYTFSMQCEEEPDIALHDGTVRIFLNTHGTDEENITPELKELLEFMEHTNETDKKFHSERVKSLRESVQTIQANEEMGVRYMQAWEERVLDRQEGKEEGLKEGRAKGREEGRAEEHEKILVHNIKNLMETMDLSEEQAMDALKVSERDRETVRPLL